jgi:hypothetical protein
MTQTIGIPTFGDRVSAIEQFGYTRREAEFLVVAALHSGYFLRRQFSERGKANDALCRKLLSRNHGKLVRSAGYAHVYHICGKPLFRALGQADNRHRRNHESFYIRRKIMLLDYVRATRQGPQFLATEEDKVAYFSNTRGLDAGVLPAKKYFGRDGSQTARFFVDKFPVRVNRDGGTVSFSYIDDGMSNRGFGTWLTQIRPLLAALGSAEIVFVSPSVEALGPARREFERRFQAATNGLGAYFQLRQQIEITGLAGRSQEVLDRYREGQRRFGAPQFEEQYIGWKQAGAAGAVGREEIRFSTHTLPFLYGMFGDAVTGKDSNVGLRDDSPEIEGSCVCFAETKDREFVRIGFSPSVVRRVSDLGPLGLAQLQQSGQPRLLGYIPGTAGTERWLHNKFSAQRQIKKWFRASNDLRTFIDAVGLLEIKRGLGAGE